MLVFHFQIQITALHLHTGKLMITATFSTSVVSSAEDLAGFFPQEKTHNNLPCQSANWKTSSDLHL